MFGHDDEQTQNQDASQTAPAVTTPTNDGQDEGATTAPAVVGNEAGNYIDSDSPMPAGVTAPGVQPSAAASDTTAPAAPAEPAASDESAIPAAPSAPSAPAAPAAAANPDDLLDIKQQALQQLSPLVGHLDQTPEEKFRTTMMMIQASDNSDLVQAAYDAALQIPDEKVRAQALLDIVNEINYFTHNTGGGAEPEAEA